MTYIDSDGVYRTCGITDTVVSTANMAEFILRAEAIVEKMMGTSYQTNGATATDYYIDGDDTDELFLPFYPIKTISELSVSTDGITYTSVTTTALWAWNNTGKIKLKPTAEVAAFYDAPQSVKITYNYGETASYTIKRFTEIVAGMMALTAQIGGTFDDVTSYQLPELSMSKGEPYTNIRETINRLEKELNLYLEKYIRPNSSCG